jgi:hypothetical protein
MTSTNFSVEACDFANLGRSLEKPSFVLMMNCSGQVSAWLIGGAGKVIVKW